MNSPSSSDKTEIVSHHSLRGIAAILVVFYHMKDISHDRGESIDSLTGFFSYGYLWVDFFFILSGFILSHVYKSRLSKTTLENSDGVYKFYLARFARIYPLHLITLLGLLAIEMSAYQFHPDGADAFTDEKKSVSTFVANIFLVHGWGIGTQSTSWNIPSWSISTEAACYLAFPPLILLLRRASIAAFASVTLGVPLVIYGAIFFRHQSIEDAAPLLRCFAGFIFGMGVFSISSISNQVSRALTAMGQVVVILGILISMHIHLSHALIILQFGILISLTARDTGVLAPVLRTSPLFLLGTLSYSIYLTHWLVYRAYWIYGDDIFHSLASNYSPDNVSWLKYTVFFTLVIVTSFATYRLVEMPARRFLNAALSKSALMRGVTVGSSN